MRESLDCSEKLMKTAHKLVDQMKMAIKLVEQIKLQETAERIFVNI
jgi:hypothetical protein